MYTFTTFVGLSDDAFILRPSLTKAQSFRSLEDAQAWGHSQDNATWIRQTHDTDKSQVRWCYVTKGHILSSLPVKWHTDLNIRSHFEVVELPEEEERYVPCELDYAECEPFTYIEEEE